MRDRVRALWLGRITLWILTPLVLLAGVFFWAANDYYGAGPLDQTKIVVIDKGASLEAISTALADAGVVDHPRIFALGATLVGRSAELKAGEYEFPARISPALAVELLDSGKVVRHKLTIPEGLTSAEVVVLLNFAPALDGKVDPPPAEGSLLPETYQYLFGERREDLIARMNHGMGQALDAAWARRSAGLPLKTPEEALILASIVEKETARPEERARIAGVYIERLKRGMRLQADPTVAYAVTQGGTVPMSHPLDRHDLTINSPYNTYLVKGLPPTPIANPGLASIQAAVNPDDRGELYFVADGKGGHTFSKSLAEHNQGVTQLRRHQRKPAAKTATQTGTKSP